MFQYLEILYLKQYIYNFYLLNKFNYLKLIKINLINLVLIYRFKLELMNSMVNIKNYLQNGNLICFKLLHFIFLIFNDHL